MFPELRRSEQDSMKASGAFFKGLGRRLFKRRPNKVFVLGFHKSGTTSLGKALQILGYKVCGSLKEGYDYKHHKNPKEYIFSRAEHQLLKFEAFQDTPWFLFYKELYEVYPNANYILTIRPEDKWLNSVQKHFKNSKFPFHDLIYDTSDSIFNGEHYKNVYNEHNKNVIEFFQGKKNFKILNVENAEWKDLGEFLEMSTPKGKFPHANKAKYRGSVESKIRLYIKRLYYKK